MTDRADKVAALDAALTIWAKADPVRQTGDEDALLRILAHADALPVRENNRRTAWWWMGGAVAVTASAALLVLVTPVAPDSGNVRRTEPVVRLAEPSNAESASFALLYTPSSEEEYYL